MTNNSFDEMDTSNLSLNQIDSSIKKNLKEQDFLHLMEEHIQNQDPNQINNEFLSQLVHATPDGGAEMQESLQQMTTSLQSNQALQASALVGRKVLVSSDIFPLGSDAHVRVTIDISPGYSLLRAFIYTEYGKKIKELSLGKPGPGFFQFRWNGIGDDGKSVNEGRYKIEVHAIYDGKEVVLKTLILANVDSVSLGQNGEGLKLNVAGIGPISLDRVKQISV